MQKRSLGGEWQFRREGGEWRTGTVPGGVYTDLLNADAIPDPFVEDNELDVQWVGKSDWTYRRTVDIDERLLDHDRVRLQCDGLDTVATVSVNGREVGESVNMHVGHEFDVSDALVPGENEITVAFRSPVEYGQERAAEYPYEVPCIRYPVDQPGRPFIRKAQCHYGWDWGPCLPTMGIYRDISLVAYSEPRVRYTKTEQDHDGDGIDLTVRAGVDAPSAGTYELRVDVADTVVTESVDLDAGEQTVELTVGIDEESVELWWPNGYGDQPLYDLDVTVGDGDGRDHHTHSDRVGFREVDLVVEPDDVGTSFYFEVNGEPVYAKGANTIPTAPLYGEVTDERYEHLIRSAADANMNMLRVWGGGYYEEEAFYDLCDEYGLLVWQDFMFSCSLHPANDDFLDTVEAEVRYQVRRLANHPSIAVWCANNENEEAAQNWFVEHDHHEDHLDDYAALYEETVGPACREEDPSRTYWPGSPSSGPDELEPYVFEKGDIHYWDVWHQGQPFEDYLTTEPRFVSEFGYQSFPSTDSLGTVLDESDFNPTSPMMEHHQRNPGGNTTILRRMADYFRFPFDFSDFVYLSQLLQAEAMSTAIEHWRRRKPTTMGALYWQLNDLWPVASWSSVEYDGKWKAQQYAARRQFAPVLLSFHPSFEGRDGVDNAQAEDAEGVDWGDVTAQTLWVTSDETESLSGQVSLEVATFDGEVVHEGTVAVDIAPHESAELATVGREDLPEGVDPTEVMVRAAFEGEESSGETPDSYPATAFFVDYKRLDLPEADLEVEIDGADVTVAAETAALFVELDPGTMAGAFSDNFVHLAPGEERTLAFDAYDGRRDALVETELEDELSVRHLRETY
ncbi:glycoside hydrolase family 2 sugar binding protein [Halosimplex carlsbadense 2-9-1]|uniref:Beta-mannosidase n=1 Tax=Halosimplex carlsbadense 2-9-1 TaxID=797114 RepID=M0CMT7_9EURY|nr:glycoside hydrolase family 2 protein [Halosimplex carlsbadense]ELZ23194.1 glycoside hydrolase family 2 sugar binding protein [Halosimplex carlsbadense 2-9-1]